jgi:small-conductance mechanosensitive channel
LKSDAAMKKKIVSIALLLVSCIAHADLFDTLNIPKVDKFNVVIGTNKITEDVAQLRRQADLLQKEERAVNEDLVLQSEKVKSQISMLETTKAADTQYTSKLLLTLKSESQSLTTLRSLRKDIIATVKQHAALLDDFSQEHFEGVLSERKTIYTFDDIQHLGNQIASQEEIIEHEQSRKKEIVLDLENGEKKVVAAEELYKKKLKEQSDFTKGLQSAERHVRIKGELLDAEVSLAQYDRDLAVLKVEEKKVKLAFVTDTILVQERTLQVFKKKLDFIVRISLRVDLEDVRQAEDKLKKEKQLYLTVTDGYLQSIEKLAAQQEKIKKELSFLEKSFGEPGNSIQNLNEWSATVSSAEGYLVLAEMGFKNDELLVVDREVELLQAQIECEKEKFKEQELNGEMILSWHKMKHQKFKTSDELHVEVKKYQDQSVELLRERSSNEDKRTTATNRLNMHNRALSNLKNHKEQLRGKNKGMIGYDENKYARIMEYFDQAQVLISRQIEITGNLIEVYSKALVYLNSSLKHVDAMIRELQRINLWHRSRGAISWDGIKNVFSDTRIFLSDLHTLAAHSLSSGFDVPEIVSTLLDQPLMLFLLLVKLFALAALFWAFYYCLPRFADQLLAVQRDFSGVYIVGRISGFVCQFLFNNLITIFLWAVGLYYFGYHGSSELYPSMLFYLFSIPYLLYLARKMVRTFIALNQENNYDIVNESFQPRFALICYVFLYATVVILCFREAFLLGGYSKSELPNILLAAYSIIIRGLLLTFIRKEDLLSLIPSKTPFWAWVWNVVNNYYYVFLGIFIVVMILSDPYIGGYDNLMTYIFWGVLGTAIVIKALFLFYGFFRRTSVLVFFSSERELLRERFYLAKTWYSILAIFLLVFFILLGVWLISWFWGKTIPLGALAEFFTQKTIIVSIVDGQHQKISVLDILRTISFLPLSVMVASFIDKFVLYRIFGMLLVDPGVHNTVSTISYYMSAITVITLGLWYEGFGFLVVYYLGPLLFGMAWALRDVFNDFVAYFIILVQRPLKVGDYIKLDQEVMGVVRRITPRSVVLRRQNSYSIIVPNSRIVREVVNNWDYSRSYIAFPDIVVSVRYFEDPAKVKELLLQAIQSTNNILNTPTPVIRLEEFNQNGFVFLVRAFISSEKTLEQWDIASNARFAIVKTLRSQGIDLSFPVQIMYVKKDKEPCNY